MINSSFTAELHCTEASRAGQICISTGGGELATAAVDGWLCFKGQPIRLRFDYKETVGARAHYDVSCATDYDGFLGGKLGRSKNGYLGLYGVSRTDKILSHISPIYWAFAQFTKVSFWKVELLDKWDGTVQGAEQVNIHLRDDEGYRVAAYQPWQDKEYLNAAPGNDGVILTFKLKDIRLL
ncbi:hypothetical protein ACIQUS_05645 [Pseudomonas sp. NPDC090755]|uniref:hypothetical protein n=1 Tax=Pseudomonas sp. NPDC090755 TaxID=3364481 RepID=UPI00383B709C